MIYRKEIPEPIEKVVLGKNKKSTHYLTANLFYSSVHFAVRKQVVDKAKQFLKPYLMDCPKLGKGISVSVGYQSLKKTKFDLDNKAFFWQKIICDLLQSMNKLEDDNIDYIRQIHYFYQKGESKIIFQINQL
tara:strand:- start:1131 stop:1526 length:396 start_codon:yes stop_codon:yes gene_type:complete